MQAPALSEQFLTLPPPVLRSTGVPYETKRFVAVSLLCTGAAGLGRDTTAVLWPLDQSHFRQTRILQIAAATLG